MSKFIINLLDGEEGTYELEGDRLIAAVGTENETKISICYGGEEDDAVLLSIDIKGLMLKLEENATLPFMVGLTNFVEEKRQNGTAPEEAN